MCVCVCVCVWGGGGGVRACVHVCVCVGARGVGRCLPVLHIYMPLARYILFLGRKRATEYTIVVGPLGTTGSDHASLAVFPHGWTTSSTPAWNTQSQ